MVHLAAAIGQPEPTEMARLSSVESRTMPVNTIAELPTGGQRRFVRQAFGAEVVELDGAEFLQCQFRGTTLRYTGGEMPRIKDCSFFGARFAAAGAAASTVALFKAMASPGSGLQDVVRETFGAIFGN
jgi:hypothetical protein